MERKTAGDGSVKEKTAEPRPLFVFATARRASHLGLLLALIVGLTAAACTMQQSTAPPNDLRWPEGGKTATSVAHKLAAGTKPQLQVTSFQLPLSFEPNQGQTDEQVDFLSHGRGYSLFLTATEAVLALRPGSETSGPDPQQLPSARGRLSGRDFHPASSDHHPSTVLRMQFLGDNPTPRVAGQAELPGKVNYFIGNDPAKWRSNIPTFAQVKYQNVYPGVDLVYYGNQRQVEFDLVVTPEADPAAIRLAFTGVDTVTINAQGDLVLEVAGGEVQLHQPRLYQEIAGSRQPVNGDYVLLDPEPHAAGHATATVGFAIAAYDPTKPLVIDPVLSYSTYLGGG